MNCPPLTITFLGTGTSSGVPMIGCKCKVCSSTNKKDTRLRSSILIKSKNTTIVIDTTPDFRYQMLREKCVKLDAILFTHPHKDHIAGLDDVRAFNYFQKKKMPIYANKLTEKAIKREFKYAFTKLKFAGLPELDLKIIDLSPFIIGDIPIIPIQLWHNKMSVYGYRFGNFTYITDANFIDENEKEKIKGSKVVVLNALRKESHVSHFSLSEAISLVTSLNTPTSYFTHISHQLGLHNEIKKELPKNIFLAWDELKISV